MNAPVGLCVSEGDQASVAHREFWRLAGTKSQPGRSYIPTDVISWLADSAVVFTDNARAIPAELRLPGVYAATRLASDGADLPAHLFRLKNGDRAMADQYTKVHRNFGRLTDASFDVVARDSLAHPGETEPPLVSIAIRKGAAEWSLRYAGAGVAEALFVAAGLAQPSTVIFLDEPAANLHPFTQLHLAELLQGSDSQAFVITHSPWLLARESIKDVSRLDALPRGTERYALSTNLSLEDLDKLRKLFRGSANVRSLLFASGVILAEGSSEDALALWWDRLWSLPLDAQGVAVHDVGGQGSFEILARYLTSFGVRFAVACDGPAIGDSGDKCLVAEALRASDSAVPAAVGAGMSFADRVNELRGWGVFTWAKSAAKGAGELENVSDIADALASGSVHSPGTKPRRMWHVANQIPPPQEVRDVLHGSGRWLSLKMDPA